MEVRGAFAVQVDVASAAVERSDGRKVSDSKKFKIGFSMASHQTPESIAAPPHLIWLIQFHQMGLTLDYDSCVWGGVWGSWGSIEFRVSRTVFLQCQVVHGKQFACFNRTLYDYCRQFLQNNACQP